MKTLALVSLLVIVAGCTTDRPDVQGLIKQLQDPDPQKRKDAAFALSELGPKAAAAAPALVGALKDNDTRVWATMALGKIGSAAAAPLAEALKDEDANVRKAALTALIDIGSGADAAVPELTKALSDKDEEIRKDAAYVLAAIGSAAKSAMPVLAKAFGEDESLDVKKAAGIALKAIDPEAAKRAGVE